MNPKRKHLIVFSCLLLAIGTSAIYSSVTRHPFVDFDDQYYVVNNAVIHEGLSWEVFVWSFNAGYAQNWHPLTWLSHALDCQLYGLHSSGHHLTNLVLHVMNVVILFLLLLRVTGSMGRSFLVVCLVRSSIPKRGDRGVGSRTQKRFEHAIFPACAWRLRMVRAHSEPQAVPRRGLAVRLGAGIEADGNHSSFRTSVA